jgi:DNA-binding XRE family transcriptional regulator
VATRKNRAGHLEEYTQKTPSTGRPLPARVETKSNPLVKAVSNKVKLVAAQRELTRAQLAEQLGVAEHIMTAIYQETALPGPELGTRLLKWMLDPSLSWKHAPQLRTKTQSEKKPGWVKLFLWLPRDLNTKLELACSSTGYSREAFIQVAVTRLLEHEPTMTTLKQAIAEVEKLLVQRAVNDNPSLMTMLELDEAVIPEATGKTKRAVAEEEPLVTQQIAALPVFDGVAALISRDEDFLEEV